MIKVVCGPLAHVARSQIRSIVQEWLEAQPRTELWRRPAGSLAPPFFVPKQNFSLSFEACAPLRNRILLPPDRDDPALRRFYDHDSLWKSSGI